MRSLVSVPAVQLSSVSFRYRQWPARLWATLWKGETHQPLNKQGAGGGIGFHQPQEKPREESTHFHIPVFLEDGEDDVAGLRLANHKLRRLEAVLFLSREPLPTRKLSYYAGLEDGTQARTLIRRLNELYDQRGRAFRVERVAGGHQLMTRPQFARWLRRYSHTPPPIRLSSPALETLSVIAYRQPVLRAEIEAVRGVSCGEILRQLMDRDLVRIGGRSEELGRPYLYTTTKRFLQTFGLDGLDELPKAEWFGPSISERIDSHQEKESDVTITIAAESSPEIQIENVDEQSDTRNVSKCARDAASPNLRGERGSTSDLDEDEDYDDYEDEEDEDDDWDDGEFEEGDVGSELDDEDEELDDDEFDDDDLDDDDLDDDLVDDDLDDEELDDDWQEVDDDDDYDDDYDEEDDDWGDED